jgi:photosystem II stability/assembly factor-like uncharacterized protein
VAVLAAPAVLVSPSRPAASPRLDRWAITGPGGGGALFYPTVSPHDSRRVLIGCDMTGSYLSENAGQTWRMFQLHEPARYFVFDPVDAKVIYAGTIGLWRSRDAGRSWSLVYPDPKQVTGLRIAGDHGDEAILVNGQPGGGVAALAVDPADSRVLYAAIAGKLRISKDAGATWSDGAPLTDGARAIYVDPASPAGDRTLYVAGRRTISIRRGGAWRQGAAPAGDTEFAGVAVSFPGGGGAAVVYAVAGGIFVSEDGGATWRASALPGTGGKLTAVGSSLLRPDVAYVSYDRLTLPDGRYYFGVARSADRGRTWTLVLKSDNQGASNVSDAWVTPALGAGWGGNPRGIGCAPADPNTCFITDDGRAFRTTDGGRTWMQVYSARTSGGAWASSGMDVTTCYGVHFDPFDSSRLFITYTDIGLFRSEDGGMSWVYSGAGVPRAWKNTTYWLAFDPQVRGRVWGVMSGIHDLPRPKMWRRMPVTRFNGGVCLSEDGGRTWRQSSAGMEPAAATHVLLDPASPAGARVLYVAAVGRGVYKSVNGGKTWTLKSRGIEGDTPLAWRLSRDARGTLYLVVARRTEDGSIGNAGDGALYRSTDGAETWTRLPLPAGVNGPNGLTIDPADPRRLYLAAWGRHQPQGDVSGGVFRSTDAGATWKHVLSRDQHIYDVTIASGGTLYAAGFESSAWRSDDGGDTWTRLRGYNFKWGHRVIPDPADKEKVYITTFGGSVWHGPARGDPTAPEDIAAPAALKFTGR